jgi:F420-0:gamma-glutamyl ligase
MQLQNAAGVAEPILKVRRRQYLERSSQLFSPTPFLILREKIGLITANIGLDESNK